MVVGARKVRLALDRAVVFTLGIKKFQAYPLAIREVERPDVLHNTLLAVRGSQLLADFVCRWHGGMRSRCDSEGFGIRYIIAVALHLTENQE